MRLAGLIFTVLVALEHLWFLVLEMFLFRQPLGLATFHMTQQAADTCAVLAANQGLYNGFLSAGLVTSLVTGSRELRRFILGCVVVAGIFGSASVGDRTIFLLQSLPGLFALVLTELGDKARRAA